MVTLEHVHKEYKAGELSVKALKDINLSINQGEFIAIAGPSGSGKTTMLNLIGCIDTVDSGEITISDRKVSTLTKNELSDFRRDKLGFVFQSFNLIPVLTAYENVALALSLLKLKDDEIRERTMTILDEVGLKGMEDRLPSKLSGGQQQRIAVARALVKNPTIVLADEPSANLDSKTGESILQLMQTMNEKHNTTFIFSTHDPMVMNFAKRLVMLHDGDIQKDERRA